MQERLDGAQHRLDALQVRVVGRHGPPHPLTVKTGKSAQPPSHPEQVARSRLPAHPIPIRRGPYASRPGSVGGPGRLGGVSTRPATVDVWRGSLRGFGLRGGPAEPCGW
jgi:hypothetical protein